MGFSRQEYWSEVPLPSPIMECYSAIKNNEIMPFAATWVDLEIITPSEVNQKEKERTNIVFVFFFFVYIPQS